MRTAGPGLLLAGAAALGLGHADAPPPAHTGGFGEPTCHACHFDGELNPPEGALVLRVPERFRPGKRYTLEVVLYHPEMRSAGFQLSARFAEGESAGRQAGLLHAGGDGVAVAAHGSPPVLYAHHRAAPTPARGDSVRWTLVWEAPAGDGAVLFHAAANASDDDRSEFGDRIHTAVARSQPR